MVKPRAPLRRLGGLMLAGGLLIASCSTPAANAVNASTSRTEREGYVFQLVTNDLKRDADLDDAQRLAIRAAMFDGKERC